MSKLDIYQDLRREVEVRINVLEQEERLLGDASRRLATIAERLAVLREELAEYDAAIAPLLPLDPMIPPESINE